MTDDRGGAPGSPRLRDGLRPCLITFLAVWIGVILLAAMATGLFPARDAVSVPGWAASPVVHGWQAVFTALERQDALWFLRIATTGYRAGDGSAAFFPLYPLVVRAVSWIVGGHPLFAAMLVSNLAFFGSLVVLYDLTVREFSEGVARKTIVYLAIFPTAFFFLAPYSESLFLLLSLLAFREARRDRWANAAVAGALAALTRSIGVVLAPALIVMALERRNGSSNPLPRVLAGAAVLLGPLIYFGWWELAHGSALAPIHAQANWQRHAASPLTTLWNAVKLAAGHGVGDPNYWLIDAAGRRRGDRGRRGRRATAPLAVPDVRDREPADPALLPVPATAAAVDAALRGRDLPGVLGPGRRGRTAQVAAHGDRRRRSREASACSRCCS